MKKRNRFKRFYAGIRMFIFIMLIPIWFPILTLVLILIEEDDLKDIVIVDDEYVYL